MSDKKEDFALYCPVKNEESRKRLGIKAGFFWVTVKKLSVAVSRCIAAMDDKGYDEDDFKKPVRVNFPVVNDLPPEGVFDTEFCNRYEKGGQDGITMVLIPGAVENTAVTSDTVATDIVTDSDDTADNPLPAYAYNVNGELMEDVEKDMTQSVSGKSFAVRFRANWKQPQCVTDMATWQLQEINAELMDPTGYMADIELALSDKEITSRLDKLEMRDVHCYARDIEKVFPENKRPGIQHVREFTKAWLDTEHIDRGLLVKEWQKGNRVSSINRTPSGANAGGGNKTDRNPDYEHTLDTLDVEIAMATLPMDFNIYELPGSVYRRAKEIVKKKESPFKEWSAALRATPGILDYSRAAIFALIRSAHPEFYHYPGRLQGYINANLTETDHENPTEEALTAARHTPEKDAVEEANRQLAAARGEYVEGISDPNDPKWVHNNYSASNQGEKEEVVPEEKQPVAEPEAVTRNADGTFDVSALFPPPSNQTEKTEARTEKDGETPKESNQQETAGDTGQEITTDGGAGTGGDEAGEAADPVENGNFTVPDDIQPGIYYDIPNEAYHAGPGVSKSQLDDIAVCPAFYQWRKAAPVDTEKTKALDMGTALHCRLLEPDEFKNRFIIAPEFNRRTTAGKEEEKAFLENCANSGKTVMTAEDGRKLELMYGSVMAHPGCRALLEAEGKTESSIYWTDTETGELCRIRPDKFLTNSPLILDVKKVTDMSRFARHVEEFRYHVQAAMYCEGWKAYSGETPRFAFLAVSESIDCGKYPVHLYILEDEHHDIGYSFFRRDLNTYHECKSSNKWGWGFEVIERPYWARG
ncbi:PD-(D/E)XK nuclease-like domain-containing protein [Salmonella enterica]|nr:PD-(D/E)XK nuclease-like domain-containing protein [Salmonella enterica]